MKSGPNKVENIFARILYLENQLESFKNPEERDQLIAMIADFKKNYANTSEYLAHKISYSADHSRIDDNDLKKLFFPNRVELANDKIISDIHKMFDAKLMQARQTDAIKKSTSFKNPYMVHQDIINKANSAQKSSLAVFAEVYLAKVPYGKPLINYAALNDMDKKLLVIENKLKEIQQKHTTEITKAAREKKTIAAKAELVALYPKLHALVEKATNASNTNTTTLKNTTSEIINVLNQMMSKIEQMDVHSNEYDGNLRYAIEICKQTLVQEAELDSISADTFSNINDNLDYIQKAIAIENQNKAALAIALKAEEKKKKAEAVTKAKVTFESQSPLEQAKARLRIYQSQKEKGLSVDKQIAGVNKEIHELENPQQAKAKAKDNVNTFYHPKSEAENTHKEVESEESKTIAKAKAREQETLSRKATMLTMVKGAKKENEKFASQTKLEQAETRLGIYQRQKEKGLNVDKQIAGVVKEIHDLSGHIHDHENKNTFYQSKPDANKVAAQEKENPPENRTRKTWGEKLSKKFLRFQNRVLSLTGMDKKPEHKNENNEKPAHKKTKK